MQHTSFELLHQQELPELNSYVRYYRHLRSGAELLSLTNGDENKAFGVAFRTPPEDSTGVAHILEHSVLRGSRSYPAKDPISELRKGSLKTFLNAFTYPDKTCYVLASQNTQDFYNLINVYLDAVFFPNLTRHTFEQEGWHYELTSPDQPMIFKGVVFNEMKGRYNSPEGILSEHARRSIFPDTAYGVSSGGHPQHIPDLTYEQLIAFHQRFYHPSNARIYFYGDDDEQARLDLVERYLGQFEHREIDSAIRLQSRFDAPRRSVHPYRVDTHKPAEKRSQVRVTWLLAENSDPQFIIAFALLGHVLLGTPASPLRKALLDSGLGEDLAGGGFADWTRQGYFSVGMKGIASEDAERVEALIFETLEHLAQQGLDPLAVEASLNTIEFRMRENNTGSFPRGLAAMLTALNTWLHGGDPLALLSFEQPLTALKARLTDGEPLLENMIRDFLLTNDHRTTTMLQPDPQFGAWEDAQEQTRLDTARSGMSVAEVQALIDNTQHLKQI